MEMLLQVATAAPMLFAKSAQMEGSYWTAFVETALSETGLFAVVGQYLVSVNVTVMLSLTIVFRHQ